MVVLSRAHPVDVVYELDVVEQRQKGGVERIGDLVLIGVNLGQLNDQ